MATRFGPFEIDFERELLTANGSEVRLRRQCWALLAILVERVGGTVSKEELSAKLWPNIAVEPNTLNVLLWDLRRSLAVAAGGNFIESVGRRGYRFAAVKGKTDSEPNATVAVMGADRPQPATIGRAAEIERLHAAFRAATSGQRQVIFVAGEAGIGKSFLVETFIRQLTETKDVRCTKAHCVSLEGPEEPYAAVLEAIESLCADPLVVKALQQHAPAWLVQIPSLLPPQEMVRLRQSLAGIGAERMLREAVRLLEQLAQHQPLVIVIEDLHWSDDGTLDVLASLAARTQPARLLVLATMRSYELSERESRARGIVRRLTQRHAGTSRLDLQPFHREAVEGFVDLVFGHRSDRAALATVLEETSGGNPLFLATLADSLAGAGLPVEQMGRDILAGDLPQTLHEVVSERLDRLPGDVIPLLEAASVAGVDFNTAEVAGALECSAEAIERDCARMARADQFILAVGEQVWPDGTITSAYRFRHVLYQRAIYERTAPMLRRTFHDRIGRRIGGGFGEQLAPVVSHLTHHFEAAGNWEELAKYQQAAAQIAFGRYAAREALHFFELTLRTLDCLPESPERQQREAILRLEYGHLAVWHEGYASIRARSAYERAYELAHRNALPELMARAQLGRCMRNLMTGAIDEAKLLADDAIALSQHQAASLRALALLYGGIVRIPTNVPEALTYYERAFVECSRQDSPEGLALDVVASLMSAKTIALSLAGYEDEAMTLAQSASTQIRASGAPGAIAVIEAYCACAAVIADRPAEAQRFATDALAVVEEGDITIYRDILVLCSLWARHRLGNEGLADFERATARRAAAAEKWYQGLFEVKLAECLAEAGDLARAQTWLDSAFALDEPFVRAEAWRVRGEIAGRRGSRKEACECVERARQIAKQQGAKTFERRAEAALVI